MRHTAIVGLPATLALLGCSHLQPSPSAATTPVQPESSATAPGTNGANPGKPTSSAAQPAITGQSGSASAQAPVNGASKTAPQPGTAATPQSSQRQSTNENATPSARRNSGTATAGTAGPAPGPKSSATAGSTAALAGTTQPPATNPARTTDQPQPGAPATPSLDLASLEQRLKDTRAIGLFTKLSLKNQVDDLLTQFRAFHAKKTPPLSELRQRYDLLLLKVLSLLQDGDPPLAAAISGSRESLWSILTDPQKFARL